MCRPSGVREGEKVWEEGKKEAELGEGGKECGYFFGGGGRGAFYDRWEWHWEGNLPFYRVREEQKENFWQLQTRILKIPEDFEYRR